jgi:hypothetical protein
LLADAASTQIYLGEIIQVSKCLFEDRYAESPVIVVGRLQCSTNRAQFAGIAGVLEQ